MRNISEGISKSQLFQKFQNVTSVIRVHILGEGELDVSMSKPKKGLICNCFVR